MKLFIILLLLTITGCASAQTQTPDNLAAMLFVEQASVKLPKEAVLCLIVDSKDVKSSLLDVLRQKDERFVIGSDCQGVSDVSKGSHHKQTGKPAFFISVSKFRALGNNEAEIQLDIIHHGLWGNYKTLMVREIEGRWSVIKTISHSAS